MSVYICSECGQFIDDDYNVGTEDPRSKDFEMICEYCACEILDEDGKLIEENEDEKIQLR